jgi:hypothetical protein
MTDAYQGVMPGAAVAKRGQQLPPAGDPVAAGQQLSQAVGQPIAEATGLTDLMAGGQKLRAGDWMGGAGQIAGVAAPWIAGPAVKGAIGVKAIAASIGAHLGLGPSQIAAVATALTKATKEAKASREPATPLKVEIYDPPSPLVDQAIRRLHLYLPQTHNQVALAKNIEIMQRGGPSAEAMAKHTLKTFQPHPQEMLQKGATIEGKAFRPAAQLPSPEKSP